MSWVEEAERLKFDEGKSWTEVAKKLNKYFPDLNEQQIFEKVRGKLRQTDRYKTKGKITYENKRQPTKQDVINLYEQMKKTNQAIMNLESKQNKADIHLDDDKPVGIAFWGDWHIGAKGADYERFDKDTEIIKNTDGLYVIGTGDYKDNSNAFVHPASTQEDIITTDLQDKVVEMKIKDISETSNNILALVRGCHDDWDKRNSNKDFIQNLCDISDSVNMWHGGIINLTVGDYEYRIAARHKYKNESGLNTTNTQRNFINEFGHCDIVAVAHKHFCELHHTKRMGEETVYLRSGTYKLYDEFGQKLAGYEGMYGVPVVILFPDRKEMIPIKSLETATEMLRDLRR